MGIWDRLTRPAARADVSWSPLDHRWYHPIATFSKTFAGFPIGPDTAMRISAVFACTSLLAEVIASLPCVLYRRMDNGGREKAREHRWYKTVRRKPNRRHTRIDYFGNQQMHMGLRGNALAEILDDGRTGELMPLHPDHVTTELSPTGFYRYQIKAPGQTPRTLLQDQVLHVRDLSWSDGLVGMSRAMLAREAIAVAAAGEAFVGGFFKNDATGRLVVKPSTAIDEQKRKEIQDVIQENYAGWAKKSKVMVPPHGVEIDELGQPDEAAFLIDPRRFQVSEIARFWRVPLFMIGLEEKSTTWGSGLSEQKQGFVDFTIKSWADRHLEAMNLALLDDDEQEEFYFSFLFEDLVRGDLMTRIKAYALAIGSRVMNPNEARERENMAPYEGGDEFLAAPGTAQPDDEDEDEPRSRRPPPDDDEDEETEARVRVPRPLVEDVAARLAAAEKRQIDLAVKAGTGLDARMTAYYTKHRDYVTQAVAPICQAYGLDARVLSEVAARVEGSAHRATAAGADHWRTRRTDEIAEVLTETFIAGAALTRAA